MILKQPLINRPEIGAVLKKARERAGKTIVGCAQEIGTYRQRYAAIERGEEPVGAAELERLASYMGISGSALWPTSQQAVDRQGELGKERRVYIRMQQEESVHIIVEPES